jgi:hypothetical protein
MASCFFLLKQFDDVIIYLKVSRFCVIVFSRAENAGKPNGLETSFLVYLVSVILLLIGTA